MSEGGSDSCLRGSAPRAGAGPASQILPALFIAILAVAGAIGTSGCWLAALQLAPMALSAASDVGSGLTYAAAETAGAVSGKKEDPDQFDESLTGADELDSNESCKLLAAETPGVIELRKGSTGAPEYRALKLGDSSGTVRWLPVVDQDTGAEGWRPAVNFLSMNFVPPLTNALPENGSSYLAYAPAESKSSAEQDQLTALHFDFGNPLGTFSWDGRLYQYAVAHALPCSLPPS
jgi:hypothetical protein